jgi:PqqD family protein of HPr-rel-A system
LFESVSHTLRAGVSLSWREWPPHVLVFDSASGNTHLLDEPSASVLRAIASGPATIPALLEILGAEPGDTAARGWLTALLDRLRALDLVDG